MKSKMHTVKLFLICNPMERKALAIAAMLGCSESTVRKAMQELNITPIKRPGDCIG